MAEEPDLAHYEDPAMRRSGWELRTIIIVVAVIVLGGIAWRFLLHHPGAPQNEPRPVTPGPALTGTAAPAGAEKPPKPGTPPSGNPWGLKPR